MWTSAFPVHRFAAREAHTYQAKTAIARRKMRKIKLPSIIPGRQSQLNRGASKSKFVSIKKPEKALLCAEEVVIPSEMNAVENQFSLNRGASRKQIPISRHGAFCIKNWTRWDGPRPSWRNMLRVMCERLGSPNDCGPKPP
jgi:hypothetical protein